MQVSFAKALQAFNKLAKNVTAPSLHPRYITADARRSRDLSPIFLVFEDNGEIFYHGFHLSPVAKNDFYDIQSPYAYGGPIATSSNREFLEKAWSSHYSWCIKNKILAEFIRFHPLLENWQYYNGNVIDNRQTVWINLNIKQPLSSYSTRTRTAIRKAAKNKLYVEWWNRQNFICIFSTMYLELMQKIAADKFYYFTKEYFQVLLDWNQVYNAVCIYDNRAVAGAVFLHHNDILEYHLSAATVEGKRLNATHLLLHEAVLLGQKLGCKYLHLGGGTDSSANNSLLFFKSGFSKQRAPFRIGTKIYFPAQYQQMKKEYLSRYKKIPPRFLFYRYDD